MSIWNDDKLADNLAKKTFLIAHLQEDEINITELEDVLTDIFRKNRNILSPKDRKDSRAQALASNIRRLIRIYDYIKYGKNQRRID